jgi:antitoxin component YwqK of YwqJK toxin-antitoxin module
LFTGEWKYYHQASKIVMTLENYKNGKLEGLRSVYYPSGKIAEEISYLNNMKNGLYKVFENGIEQSIYKNNEYNSLPLSKMRKAT